VYLAAAAPRTNEPNSTSLSTVCEKNADKMSTLHAYYLLTNVHEAGADTVAGIFNAGRLALVSWLLNAKKLSSNIPFHALTVAV
jgi:hypothetical protein